MRTENTTIYRPDLGAAVMEYVEGASMNFIGLRLMPIYETPHKSGTFPVIPKEVLLKLPDTSRSARGNYGRSDWTYEDGKFSTKEKGWEELMDDSEKNLLDRRSPGLADMVATKRAMGIIMRSQEKRIADTIFNATNFTANAVTNEWDDATNATPVDDVNDGVSSFRTQCGLTPDALVIGWNTFVNLKNCDQIVDRLKYTFPGIDINRMTSQQLAAVFNVPEVIVGGAVYDTKQKGIATTVGDIWNNEYAALVKIASGDDITEPCIGRTFLWTDDSPQDPVVETYREEQRRSDVYRVRHSVEENLLKSYDDAGNVVSNISAACCYLFSNITT